MPCKILAGLFYILVNFVQSFFIKNPSWYKALNKNIDWKIFNTTETLLEQTYLSKTSVFPPKEKIFRAFTFFKFEECKVVIIGQDPYHGKNQANGLAFSVSHPTPLPPSLKNIYKELKSDLNLTNNSFSGDLSSWAKQGVLLLNYSLSVSEGRALSHQGFGWNELAKGVLSSLSSFNKNIVFILWGKNAQNQLKWIHKKEHHLILEAPHPSPLSAYRGFFGSKPFSKTNHYLAKKQQNPIQWASVAL